MRYPSEPPFGDQCYWMLSIYGCRHEQLHQWIMYFSLAAHLMPIGLGGYLLWYRWRYLWPTMLADTGSGRLVRLPADAMVACFFLACVTRWLQTLMVLTDALPSFAARELFNDFSYWTGVWAVIVFMAGIIEAIPPAFVRGIGDSVGSGGASGSGNGKYSRYGTRLTVWMPPRWLFLTVFTLLILWGPCLTGPFVYMGGRGADLGDWALFDWGLGWGYSMWTANLVIIGVIATYYCISLLMIIRSNLRQQRECGYNGSGTVNSSATAGTLAANSHYKAQSDELDSVKHLQRTFLYNGLVAYAGVVICTTWAFFHSFVLRQLWSSLLMELPIHILWWPMLMFVLMKRIYDNSVTKAASLERQAQLRGSATAASRVTMSSARHSRYHPSALDGATDVDGNSPTWSPSLTAVAVAMLGPDGKAVYNTGKPLWRCSRPVSSPGARPHSILTIAGAEEEDDHVERLSQMSELTLDNDTPVDLTSGSNHRSKSMPAAVNGVINSDQLQLDDVKQKYQSTPNLYLDVSTTSTADSCGSVGSYNGIGGSDDSSPSRQRPGSCGSTIGTVPQHRQTASRRLLLRGLAGVVERMSDQSRAAAAAARPLSVESTGHASAVSEHPSLSAADDAPSPPLVDAPWLERDPIDEEQETAAQRRRRQRETLRISITSERMAMLSHYGNFTESLLGAADTYSDQNGDEEGVEITVRDIDAAAQVVRVEQPLDTPGSVYYEAATELRELGEEEAEVDSLRSWPSQPSFDLSPYQHQEIYPTI